ncbi:MAG: S49 family peptidase [Micropruina sp.]|nr:S49 family peptidase [Micropruina sp.]
MGLLNRRLDDIYLDFTTKAAADRGLALDVLEPLARGRVWTGADAHQRGLVDHLGGMDLAIDRACALAGINRDQATVRPVNPLGFLSQFKPADSSESIATGAVIGTPRMSLDVDSLIHRFGAFLGLEVPGVLSLPFRITLT